jgi:adenylate kinase family enzyme
MVVKLFVFGLPGSGKSTVSRSIVDHVHRTYKQWYVRRLCDYNILFEMFKQDTKHKNFYTEKHNGFYVTNPNMYDIALMRLEQLANRVRPNSNQLLVVEFARSDYLKAIKTFENSFFYNSAFIFLYTDINTCIERIAQRIEHPHYNHDDHFVPERAFERFEDASTKEYPQLLQASLLNDYRGKNSPFRIIDSSGSENDTLAQAKPFVDEIISSSQTFIFSSITRKLP